ncbi:Uncharacterised protein [Mycobacteroides abscessus subsp. abscessus]|nr:Uncharacterised protein [Mycobacteroides abscessus subsp. abscessus]
MFALAERSVPPLVKFRGPGVEAVRAPAHGAVGIGP